MGDVKGLARLILSRLAVDGPNGLQICTGTEHAILRSSRLTVSGQDIFAACVHERPNGGRRVYAVLIDANATDSPSAWNENTLPILATYASNMELAERHRRGDDTMDIDKTIMGSLELVRKVMLPYAAISAPMAHDRPYPRQRACLENRQIRNLPSASSRCPRRRNRRRKRLQKAHERLILSIQH